MHLELGERILQRLTADIHLIQGLHGREPCGAALIGWAGGSASLFFGLSHCSSLPPLGAGSGLKPLPHNRNL